MRIGCRYFDIAKAGPGEKLLSTSEFPHLRSPLCRVDISQGLRKRPAVAAQVFRRVLAFPELTIPRIGENLRPEPPRPLQMSVDIVDRDEQAFGWTCCDTSGAGRQHDRPCAHSDLSMMDGSARLARRTQALPEAKRSTQPINGCSHIIVGQHGHHTPRRCRTVPDHGRSSSETARVCRRAQRQVGW